MLKTLKSPALLWGIAFALVALAATFILPLLYAVPAQPGDLPQADYGIIIGAGALSNLFTGYKAAFQQAFSGVSPLWNRIATFVPSNNAAEDYAWLQSMPRLREWVGDRQIKALAAGRYSIRNRPFEGTVSVPRADIERDNYGIYTPLMAELGYSAATHPDELVFGLLAAANTSVCYDGQYFFDTDHPVGNGTVSNWAGGSGALWCLLDVRRPLKPLIFQREKDYNFVAMTREDDEHVFMRAEYRYGVDARVNVGFGFWQMAYGSRQTLDAAAFNAAYSAMQTVADDTGRPLGVTPSLLVVGPTNRAAALEVVKAERDALGATNVNRDAVDVLVVPWLV